VRFVESEFDAARTEAEVRSVWPQAKNVSYRPMSLRSIFLAMAKAGRSQVAEERA